MGCLPLWGWGVVWLLGGLPYPHCEQIDCHMPLKTLPSLAVGKKFHYIRNFGYSLPVVGHHNKLHINVSKRP